MADGQGVSPGGHTGQRDGLRPQGDGVWHGMVRDFIASLRMACNWKPMNALFLEFST